MNLGHYVVRFGICLTTILTTVMVSSRRKRFQQRMFAWFYGRYVAPGLTKQLRPCKEELFEPLFKMTSVDPQLAAKGKGVLRILEIGIGTGLNLEFYPPGTQLVSVEPNTHFTRFFDRNRESFSHVELEKSVLGTAEDMKEVETGTIDVVVSTYVLCSVKDVKAVMEEIVRVLVPGGRFFYLEHISYKHNTWGSWMQILLEPIWRFFSDDCRLTMETSDYIRKSGFSSLIERNMQMEEGFYVMRPHILGVATK